MGGFSSLLGCPYGEYGAAGCPCGVSCGGGGVPGCTGWPGSGGGIGGGGGGGGGVAGTNGGGLKSAAGMGAANCARTINAAKTIFDPSLPQPLRTDQTLMAIASISTRAPLGSPATWTVARAGKFSVKNRPYTSFTLAKSD